jgi:hypothetical protein
VVATSSKFANPGFPVAFRGIVVMDPSPRPDPDEINYYAAPEALLREGHAAAGTELTEAEATRKRYLNHEGLVRGLKWLYFLAAIPCGYSVFIGTNTAFVAPSLFRLLVVGFTSGLTALNVAVGVGLWQLKTWARWTVVGLNVLSMTLSITLLLFYFGGLVFVAPTVSFVVVMILTFALLIAIYILYLLLSPNGSMVFSPEYEEVINRTPHIKYKRGFLVKVFLGAFLICAVLVAISLLFDAARMLPSSPFSILEPKP